MKSPETLSKEIENPLTCTEMVEMWRGDHHSKINRYEGE
jgi:hypothetical protein